MACSRLRSFGTFREDQKKDRFHSDLLQQNGCFDLLILEDVKAFGDLPAYSAESITKLHKADVVRRLAVKTPLASVFGFALRRSSTPSALKINPQTAEESLKEAQRFESRYSVASNLVKTQGGVDRS